MLPFFYVGQCRLLGRITRQCWEYQWPGRSLPTSIATKDWFLAWGELAMIPTRVQTFLLQFCFLLISWYYGCLCNWESSSSSSSLFSSALPTWGSVHSPQMRPNWNFYVCLFFTVLPDRFLFVNSPALLGPKVVFLNKQHLTSLKSRQRWMIVRSIGKVTIVKLTLHCCIHTFE